MTDLHWRECGLGLILVALRLDDPLPDEFSRALALRNDIAAWIRWAIPLCDAKGSGWGPLGGGLHVCD